MGEGASGLDREVSARDQADPEASEVWAREAEDQAELGCFFHFDQFRDSIYIRFMRYGPLVPSLRGLASSPKQQEINLVFLFINPVSAHTQPWRTHQSPH